MDKYYKLQTTLFQEPCDHQNFLNAKLEHLYLFHTARQFEFEEYIQNSKTATAILENLMKNLFDKGYQKDVAIQQIQKVDQLD